MGIIQFGLLYYLPLYYQLSKGYSPLISGVALLPQCVLSSPTTTITSIIISKTGKYRIVIWIGWTLMSLGCGLLVLLTDRTTVAQWIFINAVSGVALGFLFTSQSVATQAASDLKHMAIASGLSPFFRTLGQAFGIVIGDSIFQNTLRRKLSTGPNLLLRNQADSYSENVTQLGAVLKSLPDGSQVKQDLLDALNPSFHAIWWTLMAFSLVSLLLSLCIPQLSMDRAKPPTAAADAAKDPEKGDAEQEANQSEKREDSSGTNESGSAVSNEKVSSTDRRETQLEET